MNFELGEGVTCDLTKLLVSRLLIQANSGGGKSRTIRRILEQTYGHVQQIILDTEGEFATLREKFDYIYAAKSGGDTAVEPRAAKLLAERLLKLGVSAILDLSELKATPRIQFVRYFLEALMEAPKELWHPVLIILDEGHTYCPQNGEAESAAAVIDTATRGRKRSFCLIIATQRLSKLHKDAAAELNNKMIGRTGLDVDMNRAADELGFATKDQKRELRALDPGRFFIFGPALPVGVNTVLMGPVQTRHPEPGSKLAFTPPPPTAKIKALLPQLKDLPAEAEERHKSFEDVRKENAQLRRQLTLAERAAPTKVETKVVQSRVEVPVLTPADLRRLETAAEKISKVGADVTAVVHTLNVPDLRNWQGRAGQSGPHSGAGAAPDGDASEDHAPRAGASGHRARGGAHRPGAADPRCHRVVRIHRHPRAREARRGLPGWLHLWRRRLRQSVRHATAQGASALPERGPHRLDGGRPVARAWPRAGRHQRRAPGSRAGRAA